MICRRNRRGTPKSALITGASSGIGAAFARALPAATDLLLVARDKDALEALRAELEKPGRRVEILAADLATAEGRQAVIGAGDAFALDLLVNNAGSGRFGRFLDNDAAGEAQTVEVNVAAPTLLARHLLPGMIARARSEGGRAGLVNLASTAAFLPVPDFAVYAASKAYSLSLSEALAAELSGEPVDVLCVCPGATRTAFGARAGYRGGSLPGAIDPARVARRSLEALGRQRVVFTDLPSGVLLTQISALRELMARSLGLGTGLLRSFSAQRAKSA